MIEGGGALRPAARRRGTKMGLPETGCPEDLASALGRLTVEPPGRPIGAANPGSARPNVRPQLEA